MIMQKDKRVYEALNEIADRLTKGHTNPFPKIERVIRTRGKQPLGFRFSISHRFLYIFFLLIAVITVAYTCYRIALDPGLQAVDNAGLISHLRQVAKPTQFTNLTTQSATSNGLFQSQNGITVTLDWVYADSSRVDFALIIEGLNLPEGAQIGDYICEPYVYSQEHIGLIRPGIYTGQNDFGVIGSNQEPGTPIMLKFEYQPRSNINSFEMLNLGIDLTIGPCGPKWSAPAGFTGPWSYQTATPPPLIGNYHFSVQVPVSKSLFLTPNQTIVIDNVSMRLETLTLSPSFTQIRLCQQILNAESAFEGESDGYNITIQMDDQPPVKLDAFANSIILKNGWCGTLGAAISNLTLPNQVIVRISNYKSVDSNGNQIYVNGPWIFTINLK